MKTPLLTPLRNLSIALAVAVSLAPLTSNAASGNWTGATDNTWQGANWSVSPAPGSTAFSFTQADTATFNTTGSNVVSIDSGRNIKSIAFTTLASTYTIGTNGGNSLLLANGGSISTAVASQFETIAAPLILEPASATTAGSYQFVATGGTGATASTLNFTGPISGGTTTGGIALTLSGSSNNTTGSVISGDISDAIGSGLSISKANTSTWSLTGTNNSFTGGLNVNQGVLQVATISTIGNNSSIGAGGGITALTASGGTGTLRITGAGGTTDRAITIVRSGAGSGSGLIIDSSGTAPVTFSGGISSSAAAAVSTTSFNTLTLAGNQAGANTISGNITDFDATAGNEKLVAVTKSNTAALWILNSTTNGSNYSGLTTISGGTMAGIGTHAFGSTSGISISGTNGGILSLRGNTSTSFVKASDSSSYAVTTSSSGATINADQATVAGTTSKTMTIGTLGTTSTAATYVQNFTGANNTSLSVGAVTGPVSTAIATVNMANAIAGGGSLTLASYTSANTSGGETVTFSGVGNTTVTGNIAKSATTNLALTKSGAGTLTINNSNHNGTTTVSGGILLVNGAHSGAGAYSLTTGTLGGIGTITTAGNAGVTAAAGSKLTAGDTLTTGLLTLDLGSGALNISGAVTATNTQSMIFDLSTVGGSDRILLSNASSTLNIGSGVLNFDDFTFNVVSGFTGGTYVLFDTNNTITGTLGASLTGLVNGQAASIAISGQDIVLTAIPEPSTYAMLLGGFGLLVGVQRIRRRRA